jgi:hypothetical protein
MAQGLRGFRRVRGFGGALGGRKILAWKQGNDRSRDRENRHQGRAYQNQTGHLKYRVISLSKILE